MSIERGHARVRALHTSPDAPTVDLFVDGTLAVPNLAFGQVSDYLALSPGSHRLRIFPAGTGGQGSEVLNASLEDLGAGQDYTAVVLDRLEHVHALMLHDSTEAPAAGRAKVRAVHASPDAPAVDVAIAGGAVLLRNVAFRHATPFHEVDSGMVDLEVRPSGHTETIMVLPDYTLADGSLYTFVALGLLSGQPAFMIMPLVQAIEMQLPA